MNWYRPGYAGTEPIDEFERMCESMMEDFIGVIAVGDVSVHHKKWLRHSTGNTCEGAHLFNASKGLGLKQLVREPTHLRGNLLDVVLTDVEGLCSVDVLPPVADHCLIHVVIDAQTLPAAQIDRYVWD